MENETQALSKEQQLLRDNAVAVVTEFEQAGLSQARAISKIMTLVLILQLQVVALATELEILKGDKND